MKLDQFIKVLSISFIVLLILSSSSIASIIHDAKTQSRESQTADLRPSPENVYTEIDTISDWYRYLDTPGHQAAEDYIFSRFDGYGLNTSRMEYTVQRLDGSVRGCNVLGLLEGVEEPNKWLVIGGHYDANQKSPYGAYDNAAGTATVLELARFFTDHYSSINGPYISMLFATWDAEEGGGAGSKHFIDNLPDDIDVVAYINLDMYSLNYPIKNSIPGSNEEYFKLNLYTSPVNDFSGYSNYQFNDTTKQNFTIFQGILRNVTYTENDYPEQWVPVMDDTEIVSDHAHFIRNSIPAVWFRGMNEYPRNEGDINERNFKHTPVDTLETMDRYAGGRSELLKGITTGLTIAYQLAIEVMNYSYHAGQIQPDEHDDCMKEATIAMDTTGWLVAIVVAIVIFICIYFYFFRKKNK